MKISRTVYAALSLIAMIASSAAGATSPVPKPIVYAPSPSQIVAAAPASDWQTISASDLLVMQLELDAKRQPRRVIIQLMPAPFSQGWIGNIRTLAAAKFWDGTSINRVQDNYVTQWGDATEKKALPSGLIKNNESEYTHYLNDPYDNWGSALKAASDVIVMRKNKNNTSDQSPAGQSTAGQSTVRAFPASDPYARITMHHAGWQFAANTGSELWPVHCYGMVGVSRNLSPDTGTGAELYTVIGHAPRHLDRNIALVGRVIEGMEHLSALPRGTGDLGFYKTARERTAITSVRMMSEMPQDKSLPVYEFLSTESESFAKYASARANRRDEFFITPAGGADICNIPVPVRRHKQ